jgi:hypothetical protein
MNKSLISGKKENSISDWSNGINDVSIQKTNRKKITVPFIKN